MPEPGQVPCSEYTGHVRPANARRGGSGRGWQAVRVAAAACCVLALVCVATGIVGSGRRGEPAAWAAWSGATQTELLMWDPGMFEDEVPGEHNLFSDRKSVNGMIRDQSIREATDVGRRVQDHDDVGLVLGQAAHVAFATIVELKRSMRGIERGELNLNVQSKIEVAETMLQEAVKHLGITTVPPPPSDTRLSSLRSAMRLGRILRMMLARMPGGSDAQSYRETRFNLAVYDLDQVAPCPPRTPDVCSYTLRTLPDHRPPSETLEGRGREFPAAWYPTGNAHGSAKHAPHACRAPVLLGNPRVRLHRP